VTEIPISEEGLGFGWSPIGTGRLIMARSMDIRKKVMKAIAGGMSRRQAAARFDIGLATAIRWAKGSRLPGTWGL